MSPLRPAETALIALGSNLGDRAANLAAALERLARSEEIRIEAASSLYATDPVGLTDQPEFLNAAAALRTTLGPRELLAACLRVEAELGRVRALRWGPRVIDLDLLFYGELRLCEPGLQLPHPRMAERAFVLLPLAEIAPDRMLGGRRVAEAAAAIGQGGVRRLASPRLILPA